LLPFNLTYHTADFNGAGGIGLTILAFAALGVIAARAGFFARRLAWLAFMMTVLWFLTSQESRFLIHCYAIGAVFAVIGWRAILSFGPRARILSAIVAACSVFYGMFMIGSARRDDIHSVFSPSFAQQRRKTEIPFVESFDFINHDAGASKLLIMDCFVPAYYSDVDYVKPCGQWGERVLPDAPEPGNALASLDKLGISHVLDVKWSVSTVDRNLEGIRGSSPTAVFDALEFRVPPNFPGLVLVFERPDQRVYRVNRPE
jgi:hypothetical protein